MYEQVIEAIKENLQEVYDPEIPVSVYDLGLIYDISFNINKAEIKMSLTSPNCPEAQDLPEQVRQAVLAVDAVDEATIELVWEPAWNPDMMSEDARFAMGMGMDFYEPTLPFRPAGIRAPDPIKKDD